MGSGDWFKVILGKKKAKQDKLSNLQGKTSKPSHGSKSENHSLNKYRMCYSGGSSKYGLSVEELAATWIQSAFRRYRAQKVLHCLKAAQRLNKVVQCYSTEKQASVALTYIQLWSRIQAQISARRLAMVIEGRIKQRKLENKLKVEAKLHVLEVEWCGGPETMEEIIARIQQREEAAVKRERTLAYAFSHQWRPNNGQNLGRFSYEIGKDKWGWSWVDRWIAVCPWEIRLPSQHVDVMKRKKKPTKTDNKKPFPKPKPSSLDRAVLSKNKSCNKNLGTAEKVAEPRLRKVTFTEESNAM